MIDGRAGTMRRNRYNQKLSEQRVATMKEQMVRLGIPAAGIFTARRGFSQPW